MKRKLSEHCHIWPGVIGLSCQRKVVSKSCECTTVIQAEQRQCPSSLLGCITNAQFGNNNTLTTIHFTAGICAIKHCHVDIAHKMDMAVVVTLIASNEAHRVQ